MTLKRYVALLLLIVAPALVFAGGNREKESDQTTEPGNADQGEAQEIDVSDVVARVNGEPVSRAEFDNVVESNIYRYEYQSGETFDPAQRAALERQVLEGLITRAILEQESERLNIDVTDERFQETMEQFKSQFPNESAYQIALEEQGFTEEEFEAELMRQMVIEQLIRTQVYDGIDITEEEMREFYDGNTQYFQQPERVAARHIIFTTQDVEDEAARQALREELEGIRQEIADGADFAEMAQEHSQGPSAPRGGDLGTFGRGQMVPGFEEVAFNLEVGELSEVIETQFGYHIVQVTEKIPAQTQSYADSQERIRQFLTEEEQNRGAQAYVRGLREDADVEQLIEFTTPEAASSEGGPSDGDGNDEE